MDEQSTRVATETRDESIDSDVPKQLTEISPTQHNQSIVNSQYPFISSFHIFSNKKERIYIINNSIFKVQKLSQSSVCSFTKWPFTTESFY